MRKNMRRIAKVVTKQIGGTRSLEQSLSMAAHLSSGSPGEQTLNLSELTSGESEVRQSLLNKSLSMLQDSVTKGKRTAAVPASKPTDGKRQRKKRDSASAAAALAASSSAAVPGAAATATAAGGAAGGQDSASSSPRRPDVPSPPRAFQHPHRPPALFVPAAISSYNNHPSMTGFNPPSLSSLGGYGLPPLGATGGFPVFDMSPTYFEHALQGGASGSYFNSSMFSPAGGMPGNIFSPTNADMLATLPLLPTPKGDQPSADLA